MIKIPVDLITKKKVITGLETYQLNKRRDRNFSSKKMMAKKPETDVKRKH